MGFSELTTEVGDEGIWRVIRVAGEIDMATADAFAQALSGQISSGTDALLVDMRDVTFIDSTGVTALFRGYEQMAERDGQLRVLTAPGVVARVLDVSGLAQVIRVFADHAAAVGE